MADLDALLKRWQAAGVLESAAAERIRAWEAEQRRPAGLQWQGAVALILGAILLGCGVELFVSAHWDAMGAGSRFALVLAMVSLFHLAGAAARESFRGLSTALHAVGTIATGAAIALVGQIFNIQEHWPGAVLLWAVAAGAGWVLLRDGAQEALALLLWPAWMLCEFSYYADGHIGENVFAGRFLVVWAALYLTFFLGSRRKAARWILFAAAAIAALVGTVSLIQGWISWQGTQSFLPFGLRAWGWVEIAVAPLGIALFRLRKSLIPVAVTVVYSIALPWCTRTWMQDYGWGKYHSSYSRTEPTLLAHALVGAFCVFVIWWGVRQMSRALVNLGILGFALTVGWFYYSDIFDKVGRSLGLIGLGVLFLAGGWALEKMRRGLIAGMTAEAATAKEAL